MVRLDEAGVKKRSAARADIVVEVKDGDRVVALANVWEALKVQASEAAPKPKPEPKSTQLELMSETDPKPTKSPKKGTK